MTADIGRICMFTNLYPPVVSGSSTQSSFLARELARLGKEVIVITARIHPESPEYEIVEGVHVYRLPCIRLPRMQIALNFPWLNSSFIPGNTKRIVKILRKHKPSILHLHNHMFDLAFQAVRMRKKFEIPLVITIHTMIQHSQDIYNFFLKPADRYLLKNAVIRHADAIVSPDYNIREYVRSTFKTINDFIVLYGIEKPAPPSLNLVQEIQHRFQLSAKKVILSIGHVHKIRDRRELIEAMPYVLKHVPEAVLLIVGAVATDIPLRIARQLGVEKSVIFAGPVPHSDLGAYLSIAEFEAHWLNQDSPEKTSLGVASLECMSAGKVVMAVANEKTYGEGVLRNRENVLLVRPNNPEELGQIIVEVLASNDLNTKMGSAAQETVKQYFSWEKICLDTLCVYQEAARTFFKPHLTKFN
ncbi:MAG: glycosyltransferase family 4 protein [Desulfobacterales bacterium]|nr:glycosyltransferase family 4 protein [Desulfobacterales bacterium]